MNRVYGRLRPGVSVEQAQAAMVSVCRSLQDEFPKDPRGPAVRVERLHEQLVGRSRPAALLLMTSVGLILLIGCANLVALQLARAGARTREISIRAALGSQRRRLVREELVESCLLAVVGGGVGIATAVWGVRALMSLTPLTLPRVSEVRVDGSVLMFTLVLTAVTALMVGIWPAWRASNPNLGEAVKAGGRSTFSGSGRLRGGLVLGQATLVVLLVTGAGMMSASVWQMLRLDLGFDPHGVILAPTGGREIAVGGRRSADCSGARVARQSAKHPRCRFCQSGKYLPVRFREPSPASPGGRG
jgi:hypothetical protein